jgi:nitrate/TMAO reductase-like tetraheme cytochrome c subunit
MHRSGGTDTEGESDVAERNQHEPTAMENIGRVAARGFVVAGGVFWVVAAFSGPYVFNYTSLADSLRTAMWPFLATVVTLVIGWTHERLASTLLFGASTALLVWGFLSEWELGVWILMAFVLFSPILLAAILFLFAARAERRRTREAGVAPSTSRATGPESRGVSDESRGLLGARRPLLRVGVSSAAFGLVAFAVAVPLYYTASPSQCASCHSMEPYYESWHDSAHREATPNCLDCHVEPGFANYARYEIEFYGEIAGHLLGKDVEMAGVSTPGLESCQRADCHSLDREPSFSDDVFVAHAVHVEVELMECPDCHTGVVHEGVAGRSVIPPMEQCRECHEDRMGDCDYCHGEEPEETDAPDTH